MSKGEDLTIEGLKIIEEIKNKMNKNRNKNRDLTGAVLAARPERNRNLETEGQLTPQVTCLLYLYGTGKQNMEGRGK